MEPQFTDHSARSFNTAPVLMHVESFDVQICWCVVGHEFPTKTFSYYCACHYNKDWR